MKASVTPKRCWKSFLQEERRQPCKEDTRYFLRIQLLFLFSKLLRLLYLIRDTALWEYCLDYWLCVCFAFLDIFLRYSFDSFVDKLSQKALQMSVDYCTIHIYIYNIMKMILQFSICQSVLPLFKIPILKVYLLPLGRDNSFY